MVGKPVSAFILVANGTWNLGPTGIFCFGDTPPVDTWIAAHPRSFTAAQSKLINTQTAFECKEDACRSHSGSHRSFSDCRSIRA